MHNKISVLKNGNKTNNRKVFENNKLCSNTHNDRIYLSSKQLGCLDAILTKEFKVACFVNVDY